MLVVITIISLVALAISHAVRGARRTANAAKCQANLKNLHTAVVAFLADKGHYPLASSYETMSTTPDGQVFSEHVGWVSWVPSGDKQRRGKTGKEKTEWQKTPSSSHAENYYYPSNLDVKMKDAISEGSLFKYVGKDLSTFTCPEHRFSKDGDRTYLAYAMNSWFYSHSRLYDDVWTLVANGHPAYGARNSKDDFHGKNERIPSRMGLFIEMEDAEDSSKTGRAGQSGENDQQARILKGDCVWEWTDVVGLEKGQFSHRKGPTLYCHVVFLDGHVSSIPETPEDTSEWNGHADLDEVFKKLGAGSY